MKVLLCMMRKEFQQFFRHPFFPKLMVAFPLVMLLVFPWAATQEVKDLRVALVDHDHTPASRRLMEKALASAYFKATAFVSSYGEAEAMVRQGEADLVLEVDAERRVLIAAGAVNGTKGLLGAAYMQQLVADWAEGETHAPAPGRSGPTLTVRYLFNLLLDYKRFMIPALFTMLLTLLSGFLPALNIVSEKEKGTMEQLNVSPLRRWQFVLGKLLPYQLMGFVVLNLALLLAYAVYGFVPAASLWSIYTLSLLFILTMSGLGLAISNLSDTLQQAMFVMFFFMLIFLLMSGLFTPVSSMPDWAQWIAALNPARYFIEAIRILFLRGSMVSQLLPDFVALLLFALLFNGWAMLTYKKQA